jgi:hypothetical protein
MDVRWTKALLLFEEIAATHFHAQNVPAGVSYLAAFAAGRSQTVIMSYDDNYNTGDVSDQFQQGLNVGGDGGNDGTTHVSQDAC